mmetsp:Transcript_65780/g.186767  ORF Transcript_65780/g.186767 Transcript_65780/m.186767 type:complete len:252 (+) Transcript_65780:77-832(+)
MPPRARSSAWTGPRAGSRLPPSFSRQSGPHPQTGSCRSRSGVPSSSRSPLCWTALWFLWRREAGESFEEHPAQQRSLSSTWGAKTVRSGAYPFACTSKREPVQAASTSLLGGQLSSTVSSTLAVGLALHMRCAQRAQACSHCSRAVLCTVPVVQVCCSTLELQHCCCNAMSEVTARAGCFSGSEQDCLRSSARSLATATLAWSRHPGRAVCIWVAPASRATLQAASGTAEQTLRQSWVPARAHSGSTSVHC